MILILFFLVLFLSSPVSADELYNEFSDWMNATYIDTVSGLPPNNLTPDKNGTVVINLLDKQGYFLGNLAGWVDILGFRNMARIDGIDYVNTTPEKAVIVQHDASYAFTKRCNPCYLDSLQKNVSIISNRNITVWLNVTMKWHRVFWVWCGDGCEYPVYEYHVNYLNISDTEKAPQIYNLSQNVTIDVKVYNYSFSQKRVLHIREGEGITAYDISTATGDITRRRLLGQSEYNQKGVAFVNYTHLDFWSTNGTGFSRYGNDVVLNNNTEDNFTARFYTPFGEIQSTPIIQVQEVLWKTENTLSSGFFFIIFIVGVPAITIRKIIKEIL